MKRLQLFQVWLVLPLGNKPLPEPMLIEICSAIYIAKTQSVK